MRLITSIFLVLFIVGCTSSSGGGGQSGATVPPVSTQNLRPGVGDITILGDSLAEGLGSNDVSVIPIGCLSRLPHANMIDQATSGLTSEQILARVSAIENATIKPKLIFVSSGGNDAIINNYYPGQFPADKTMSIMAQMFDRLVSTGALVVYLGLNPGIAGSERLPAISNLAVSKGVLVVDGMNGFWNNPALMSDSYHPNTQGYQIMCDRMLNAVNGFYP